MAQTWFHPGDTLLSKTASATSQISMVDPIAIASVRPSAEILPSTTGLWRPDAGNSSVAVKLPSAVRHTFASQGEADARASSPWRKATSVTASQCPGEAHSCSPSLMRQSRTKPSLCPVASRLASGERAMLRIGLDVA